MRGLGLFLVAFLLLAPAAAAHSSAVTVSPLWMRSYDINTFYINVKNSQASTDAISEVSLINPMNISVGCGAVPTGWDLASPFGEAKCAYASATNPIAPGESLEFYFYATFPQEYTSIDFTIKTKGGDEKRHDVSIKVDALPPTKPQLALPKELFFKQREEREFEFSTEDNLGGSGVDYCSVSINLNDIGNLSYSNGACRGTLGIPTLDEGKHTLYVEAFDKAGNSEFASFDLLIDNTAPVITSLAVSDSSAGVAGFFRPGKDARLTAQISDEGSGFDISTVYADVASLTNKAEDARVTPTSCTSSGCDWVVKTASGLSGALTVKVTASDQVANINSVTTSAVADSKPPTVKISSPHDGEVYSLSGATIIFSVSDAESKVSQSSVGIEIDGSKISQFLPEKYCAASATGYECSFQLSGYLSDGSHEMQVSATDKAGNPAEITSVHWTVDKTPPAITTAYLKYDVFANPLGLSIFAKATDTVSGVRRITVALGDAQTEMEQRGSVWFAKMPSSQGRLILTVFDGAGNSGTRSIDDNAAVIFVSWLCLYILSLYLLGKIIIAVLKMVKAPSFGLYKPGGTGIHHRVGHAIHRAASGIKEKLTHRQKYQYHPKR